MKKINTISLNNFLEIQIHDEKFIISICFSLMLINPNISIAAESPVDVQEVFVGSETMDGDALKYPK